MKKTAALLVVFLTGCTTTTSVIEIGKDTYSVGARDSQHSGSSAQNAAYAKAADYCSEIGKKLVVQGYSTEGGSSTVTFHCFDENDPRYTEVLLQPTPDTVIEDRR